MSKTTTASSGGQVRGAKKVQRKKSNRRRFDASKVKKSSVKRGSASGSISKKAIEAVTEKGHRKVSQKRQATTRKAVRNSKMDLRFVFTPLFRRGPSSASPTFA